MTVYLTGILVILSAQLLYFRLAEKYRITDVPNERSSHSRPTIRGGGIVFPLAALTWFVYYGFPQPWMIAGLLLVAVVSFLDDLHTLPGRWRLLAQVLALTLMLLQTNFPALPWYYFIPLYIVTIGWINGFNFMDGINAITPFYSLVALGTFLYLNNNDPFVSPQLIILLIIAVLIFSYFNARKQARTFAGDVGSVSMAYLLAYMILMLISVTGRWEFILLFSVYAVDTVITILYRLSRGENIFRAHRSHLYQLLSNELGWPHVLVASIYALAQLMVNVAVIVLIRKGMMGPAVFGGIAAVLVIVYLLSRRLVRRRFPLSRE